MRLAPLILGMIAIAFCGSLIGAADKPPKEGEAEAAADMPATFELGEQSTLGSYTFSTPKDWTAADMKDQKLAAMYRSQDKAAVIRVQVRPKAAVTPEAVPKYAPTVIQKLKQDFLKNKTEIIEPPAVKKDPRFFLTIREVIKIKEGKTAAQSHLYLMPGRDLIELTVITTSDVPEQIAATEKLAQDMLLSFKATGK